MTVTEPTLKSGRIVGIAGPVIDVEFPPEALGADKRGDDSATHILELLDPQGV